MTKKIYLLAPLLFCTVIFAQTDDKGFRVNWSFRAYGVYPIQFGDHALAKAHDSDAGFGLNAGLFSYDNFKLSGGYEFIGYRVTDKQKIGNIDNSNYTSWYLMISYDFAATEKIHLNPDLGYGAARVRLKSGSQGFGHQDGDELRLGLTANYQFTKWFSVFLGARFIHTRLDINTDVDYESFFGQANQVQVSAGIKFD